MAAGSSIGGPSRISSHESASFLVLDFEEPRLTVDPHHLARNARELDRSRSRPYSVAFKLRKKAHDPSVQKVP